MTGLPSCRVVFGLSLIALIFLGKPARAEVITFDLNSGFLGSGGQSFSSGAISFSPVSLQGGDVFELWVDFVSAVGAGQHLAISDSFPLASLPDETFTNLSLLGNGTALASGSAQIRFVASLEGVSGDLDPNDFSGIRAATTGAAGTVFHTGPLTGFDGFEDDLTDTSFTFNQLHFLIEPLDLLPNDVITFDTFAFAMSANQIGIGENEAQAGGSHTAPEPSAFLIWIAGIVSLCIWSLVRREKWRSRGARFVS